MYRPRFSLRLLLALFLFVAVGCAALLRSTPIIASAVCGTSLLLRLAAIPLCAYRIGSRRAFWFGFALFGLSYYTIVCGPWQSPGADLQVVRLRGRLPTTKLLVWAHSKLPTKPVAPPNGGGAGMFQIGGGLGGTITPMQVPITEWDDFAVVGQALWSIVIALLGATFTRWCQRTGQRVSMILLLFLLQAPSQYRAMAEESPGEAAKNRLNVMQAAIGDLSTSSADIKLPDRLRFTARPLLRYNDQTRGLLDAAIWRLGQAGRPLAFVTLELYDSGNNAQMLSYEFVSLTADGFEMKSARGPKWSPHSTDLKLIPLLDAPPPATTGRARLVQFRQIAQRFSAHEKLADEAVECRLLPQPIDRYSDDDAGILDGAVFAFANGTNPEVGLVLECTLQAWSCGAFRLSSAEIVASLDGKTFFTVEEVNSLREPVAASYYATRHRVDSILPPSSKR